MLDELRRIALFTSGVAELSRDRAERLVKKAVKGGEVKKGQASTVVKSLVEVSRQNRKELLTLIRSELQNQIAKAGVATKRDVERLERRVARLEERAKAARAQASRPASGGAAKKPAKPTAKKTTRKPPAASGGSGSTPSDRSPGS